MKLARLADTRLHTALRKLSASQVPLRTAFKLKGIIAKVDEELKKFEQCRHEALNKLGKKDSEGKLITRENGQVEFEPEQLKVFAAEVNDLGTTDVDVSTVTVADLGDKVELTTDELNLLDGIIVE